jgi:tetratricopeptide (TPR) repeat protein
MKLPDGRPLVVDEGILLEPSAEGSTVLWLPGECSGGYKHWERLVVAPRATMAIGQGVCSVAAASVPVRHRLGGSLGKLLSGLRGSRGDRTWTVPGGEVAEQCGPRRADLRLAWAEDATTPLDERRITSLWPNCRERRAIGPNLYFVAGIAPQWSGPGPAPRADCEAGTQGEELPQEASRALAEQALETARAAGDLRQTVVARTDLGLALLQEGETRRAAAILEEAFAEAEPLGDRALRADVLSNLAFAVFSLGQPGRARRLLVPALAHARAAGDRYAQKLAHDRMARVLMGLGDRTGALEHLIQALRLAGALGDRTHEAVLLWLAAIAYAELGDRDQATAAAEAAIDRYGRLGHPATGWYAHHLANYRLGSSGATLPAAGMTGNAFGGTIDAGAATTMAGPAVVPSAPDAGPGPLHMALTGTKAMATFVGSGFKITSPLSSRARLAACAACDHHTGVRCRLCSTITAAKARMLHERCPLGRWVE